MEMPLPPTPFVTVILTVYKRKEFLSEALESALAQSFRAFEIIVVDDSGTAASEGLVTSCDASGRVRYLPNKTTVGVARSIVTAVEQARGNLIAILNDDDVWEQGLLEELAAPLANDPGCVAAFSDHTVIDKSGHTDDTLSAMWSDFTERSRMPGGSVGDPARYVIEVSGFPTAICVVFRRDVIDWSLVTPEVTGAYDYWISCLLAASGGSIFYVPKTLARYRVHSEMETCRRSHDNGENLIYIYSFILERAWFPDLNPSIKAKLAEACFGTARQKLRFGDTRESRRLFWKALLVRPSMLSLAGFASTFLPSWLRSWLTAVRRWIRPEQQGRRVSDEIKRVTGEKA